MPGSLALWGSVVLTLFEPLNLPPPELPRHRLLSCRSLTRLPFMDPLDKQSAQVQVTMSAETGVGSGGAVGELHPQALLLVLSGVNKSWPMGNSEGSGD